MFIRYTDENSMSKSSLPSEEPTQPEQQSLQDFLSQLQRRLNDFDDKSVDALLSFPAFLEGKTIEEIEQVFSTCSALKDAAPRHVGVHGKMNAAIVQTRDDRIYLIEFEPSETFPFSFSTHKLVENFEAPTQGELQFLHRAVAFQGVTTSNRVKDYVDKHSRSEAKPVEQEVGFFRGLIRRILGKQ